MIENLIALRIDALHPIYLTCMDLDQVKQRLGKRLALFGNIPNELLEVGEPHEIVEITKVRLKTVAPSGGYCQGTGNSLPDLAWIARIAASCSRRP